MIDLTGLDEDEDDEAEDDKAVTVDDVVEDPPGTLKFVYFLPRPLTETFISFSTMITASIWLISTPRT